MATKIGDLVIAKLGTSDTYRLNFAEESDALDFCSWVSALDPDKDLEKFVKRCKSIINPTVTDAVMEVEVKKAKVDVMKNISEIDERFYTEDSCVYFKETGKISMPERLVDELVERNVRGEPLEPLINFWRLTALNPDPEAREGLYRFITDLHLTLTEEGLFVAYRNVAVLNAGNTKLVDFLGTTWSRFLNENKDPKAYKVIEAKYEAIRDDGDWDSPDETDSRYIVVRSTLDYLSDGNLFMLEKKLATMLKKNFEPENIQLIDYSDIGTLHDVYHEILTDPDKQPQYTDNHTKTMRIHINVPCSMPRRDCDPDPNRSCSRGLHVGSERFMSRNNFGSRGLMCLVNPRNVVAVPHEYGNGYKMRCCEYLPIGFAEYDENNNLIPLTSKTLMTSGLRYLQDDTANLQNMLQNANLKELVKHKIIPEHVSEDVMDKLVDNMNKLIHERTIRV